MTDTEERPRQGRRDGEVITFYSYKGGVGRSMALANVATLLAQGGKRVLAVDCDFEAPGLHRYFPRRRDAQRTQPAGMIDFLTTLKELLEGDAQADAGAGQRAVHASAVIAQLLDARDRFGYDARVADPGGAESVVTVWPAGRFDDQYAETVRGFDWKALYRDFPYIFPALVTEWSRRYDYILLDSRTGLTDVGGICTVLMPEKLVLVFAPNNQSLHGAIEVGRQAVEQRGRSQDLRPLVLLPLMSRVENAEHQLRERWIEKARTQFERCFQQAYDLDHCDLKSYFQQVRVPHTAFYAYDEIIASERESVVEQGSLAAAFQSFLRFLVAGNLEEALDASWVAPIAQPASPPRRSWAIAVAALGVVLAAAAMLRPWRSRSNAMDPALYVGRGQEFLTAGKVEAAIVEFNHAIVEHPDYLVAHVARLRAYVLEKDLPRAETALAEMPAGLDQNTLTALHSEVERLKPKDDLRPITPGIHVHYSRHEDGATVSFVSRSFGADLRDVTLQPDIDCAEVSFYYVEDRPAARLVSDQIERELSRAGLTFKVPPAPTTLRVLPDEVQGRPRGAIEVRLPSLSSARPCSMLHAERTGN